jgi:hypothetical protein
MALTLINNGDSGLVVRNALNAMFAEIYGGKVGWVIPTGGQSSVGASCGADTTEDVLANITVPFFGANGRLRITTLWTMTNSGNNKTMRVRLGGASGTIYMTSTQTTQATLKDMREIGNRNSASSQVGGMPGTSGGFGLSTTAVVTSTVDTSAGTVLVISGQKANSGETLTLESYCVELLYAA